jgi:hypothetical protein
MKQSLFQRKQMRNRRAIPDSAEVEMKRKAFFDEMEESLPGGGMEYIEDIAKLCELTNTRMDMKRITIFAGVVDF